MFLEDKKILALAIGSIIALLPLLAYAQQNNTQNRDTSKLHYPIQDNKKYETSSANKNPFDLASTFSDSVVYDPASRRYIVYQKIGNKFYKSPNSYNFDEYWKMRNKESEIEYFKSRSNATSLLNKGKLARPKLSFYDNFFNRLFGNGKIEITPQGFVDITAGYQGQSTENPTLPERARKNGGLDFKMNSQVNVNANIGNKLKFPINYNTLANFDIDNQLKLDYTGSSDDILKRFEAGNVSFPNRSALIPGAQQLFGVKTQLQFGKLFVTTILANQKSQRQSANIQGGASSQLFEIRADEYEENRHFIIGQYFKNKYNSLMKNLPAIISQVQILRMEVWVTNKIGITTEARDIVALADLGETNPYSNLVHPMSSQPVPSNNTNDLLTQVRNQPDYRNPSMAFNNLKNIGLTPVQDFEKTFARKLDSTQYDFNPLVGTLSLSQPLQTDEVLGVAFQFTYLGKVFQVGEFSQDVPPDTTTATQRVLYLKMLKATSQRPSLPIWDLMMKNVYSVGYGYLSPQNFKLDVLYNQAGLGIKRYVPFGDKNQGTPILSLINLDRLNNQRDPQPDGVFDFVEGYTVNSQYSRIMFPVLEPFGRDLAANVYSDTSSIELKDTLYYALYDSIKSTAQQFPNQNRFVLKGSAETSGSSDISIGYNIPRGSVRVTAGGRTLSEGFDYEINYDLGTIKVINQAIINSGIPVQVNYENNAGFGIQQRSYMGLRFDYLAKNTAKTQFSIGGTMVRLSERPFFSKVDLNEDPIRNSMYGLDVNYRRDAPRITKWLNKLPFYQSAASSNINLYAEAAMLKPGHAPQIGKGSGGAIYIDAFEGSNSGLDLRFPAISWQTASTPVGATDFYGNTLFPEASLSNNLDYGKNRAKMAWYQIEQSLQQIGGPDNPITGSNAAEILSDPRMRQVFQKEIFPQKTTGFGESFLQTFDLAYYPTEKGPYNYDDKNIDANGKLLNPKKRWAGLMRSIDQTDFETANIEFIEFWLQDPFINSSRNPNAENSSGGKLYFNLGNISEDVLKDGQRFYENGLPTPNAPAPTSTSQWGRVPRNPVQVTNAFTNNAGDRPYQDQGFDGALDTAETNIRRDYLNTIASNFGSGSNAYKNASKDPSSDNFTNYRDASFNSNADILSRYKNFNSSQGNSKVDDGNSRYISAATLYPDAEDLNRDNTLSETEEYFQYVIDVKPKNSSEMQIGENYIVDKKDVDINLIDGGTRKETWYQFRVPISSYNAKVGSIPDFKSIRFFRMFVTDFEDSVVMRFGELQLTRNIWRKYRYKIDSNLVQTPASVSNFSVGVVNIEENDQRIPLPYRTPVAIERQQIQSNNGVTLLQNEQSMSLKFCGLTSGDAKGVFQTFTNRDLRRFKKLQMYIHLEEAIIPRNTFGNKDMTAVVRLGQDFSNNYYEIRIPLSKTPLNSTDIYLPNSDAYNDTLWIPNNSLDLALQDLIKLKQNRNTSTNSLIDIYREVQPNGQTYSILGNPNLAEVRGILLGVENTQAELACGEMWVNELRLTSIDEKGGYAALAKLDIALADLGNISISANGHTNGFGTLEQRINERYRDNFIQFDATANLELGKLLPKKLGLQIPVLASYSQAISTPQYDPYDLDITLKDKYKATKSKTEKDSIRNAAVDFTSTKTLSFTNVRKIKTNDKAPKIYDVENLNLSYSYSNVSSHTPLIESNDIIRHRAAIGYDFAPQPKYIEPFKNILGDKSSKWLKLIKDFNINIRPSQLTFRADLSRQFGAIRPRSIGSEKYKIPETYDKYFVFQRDYILAWNLSRSLKFDYSASNNSRIDEPAGRLDTKVKKDSLWRNLWKGGRNTVFRQTANVTYSLPTSKFPALDWTTINVGYQAGYNWIGASRLAVELGNIIENNNRTDGTVQLDFNRLYQKSKWLRQLDKPKRIEDKEKWKNRFTKITDSVTTKSGKKILATRKILDKSAMPYVSTVGRVFGKLLTSVKEANMSYSTTANTRLPGYTDSTQYFGENFRSKQPGFDFIFGKQPDTSWLNRKAIESAITKDSNFNYMMEQSYTQGITAGATISPIRDLNITINISKNFSKNYSETFRYVDTSGGSNPSFRHLTPYTNGGFDVSYISFKTLFEKQNPDQISKTFQKFEANRLILSERLGKANPNSQVKNLDGYYLGYNKYAIDVLIPSFIAAYTGKDASSISLINQSSPNIKSNPFKAILPRPNWKLDYSGLTKIKGLDKIFTSFNISHGYSANLSMNGFTSALLYQDGKGYPIFIDSANGNSNFIPYFLVPNVTITEQFSPLARVDMSFVNDLGLRFEYSKSRTLSLSLYDFQLSEVRSTELTIGGRYRKRGLKLPFNIKWPKFLTPKDSSRSSKLENEIQFQLDIRVRDNIYSNSKLDQEINYSTGGSKDITIQPNINYYLSNKVNLRFYYDLRKVMPYISSSAPTTTTGAGVQIRISLAQ